MLGLHTAHHVDFFLACLANDIRHTLVNGLHGLHIVFDPFFDLSLIFGELHRIQMHFYQGIVDLVRITRRVGQGLQHHVE